MAEVLTPSQMAVMEAKEFGATLKKLRTEADLTQAELGELSGLGQNTISQLERGDRKPAWETVLALCLALNVSCEVFRPPADEPRRSRPRKPRGEGEAG